MNPQNNRKRKKSKGRGARISQMAALLVLFCICIGGVSMVSAKYIQQTEKKDNSAVAKEFYFESDLLDDNVHEVVPTEDNGTTASVTIRLKNHVDALRYSEVAINYSVTVKEKGNDLETADGVTVDAMTGTIAADASHDQDVVLSGLKAGTTYTVTATTNNIYQKTLTGTIRVIEPDNQVYASVSDKTQYIEVTVWTLDHAGKVTLTYDDIGLIPDNTDTKMANVQTTGGTITDSNWGANTSHVFRFFKSDMTKSYKVEISGQEVTVSEK